MNPALVSALAVVAGTILGTVLQLLTASRQRAWQLRDGEAARRRQAEQGLIDDRRQAYVEFMSSASAYGNRLAEAWKAQHGGLSDDAVEQAVQRRLDAHDGLMQPLWRMRILASEPVREAGEQVMASLWEQVATYDTTTGDDPAPRLNRESWTPARDRFLDQAREELQALLERR